MKLKNAIRATWEYPVPTNKTLKFFARVKKKERNLEGIPPNLQPFYFRSRFAPSNLLGGSLSKRERNDQEEMKSEEGKSEKE